MHEQIFAKQIIDEASKYGDVKSITISVGDLAHVPADDMRNIMISMTKWDINVVNEKAVVNCACGHEGEPKIVEKGHDLNVFKCSVCGKMMPEIVSGEDITLVDLTIKDKDE